MTDIDPRGSALAIASQPDGVAHVDDVPTPAVVIDRPALDRNLQVVADFFARHPAKLRPHAKCHKSVALAHRQLSAGGTVGGVCVAKLSEAEVMVRGGIIDVLIANEVVDVGKIRRVADLAVGARISVLVDQTENVRDLEQAAAERGARIGILIDVNTRLDRCGVEPGPDLLKLASQIAAAPHLELQGVNGYEGTIAIEDRNTRREIATAAIEKAARALDSLRSEGFDVHTLSCGGTSTWDLSASLPGVTEIQAGAYPFGDASHARLNPEFTTSLFVVASVIARPTLELAILDVGEAQLGGPPEPFEPTGLAILRVDSEQTLVRLDQDARRLGVGDRVWLIPAHCELTVNRFGYFHVAAESRVYDVWKIDAGALSQ